MSERSLDPDKNTQQGLSGPNELNLKRGKSIILPVPIFSSTVNDQPSFTLIHRGTETEISKTNATASDMLILCYQWSCRVGTQEGHCVPFLLETQHVSAWENNIEVIVILNVSKMSICRIHM